LKKKGKKSNRVHRGVGGDKSFFGKKSTEKKEKKRRGAYGVERRKKVMPKKKSLKSKGRDEMTRPSELDTRGGTDKHSTDRLTLGKEKPKVGKRGRHKQKKNLKGENYSIEKIRVRKRKGGRYGKTGERNLGLSIIANSEKKENKEPGTVIALKQ